MAECDKVCRYIDLPLQHASEPGAEADEAAGHARRSTTSCSTASASGCRASRSAPPSSSASLARPRRTSTNSASSSPTTRSTTSASSPIRTKKARRRFALDDDVPAQGEDGAAQPRHAAPEAAGPGPAEARDRPAGPRSWSTGPRPSTNSCCGAGCRPRRRTSTPSVYLTECDPSAYRAGRFRRGRDCRAPGTTTCWSARSAPCLVADADCRCPAGPAACLPSRLPRFACYTWCSELWL